MTAWYLERYHGSDDDVGVVGMFTDQARVGHFAVPRASLEAEDPDALFRVLVATTMFQRRQDVQIMRVLRGIAPRDVEQLTSAATLLASAKNCGCPAALSLEGLLAQCDLRKDDLRRGTCDFAPSIACLPKRHAVLLKRYGHFGKVPTALALNLKAHNASDLASLRRGCIEATGSPEAAAECLEDALCKSWRVSDKISAMYLSMLSNPDLWPGRAPWTDGLDWTRWVVIDSNVDLFLGWLGYDGLGTYAARREFIHAIARQIDLKSMKAGLQAFNPRIVQQAGFLFMSAANRRSTDRDCSKEAGACGRCPKQISRACPLNRR
ncbi:hypothetical protein OV090_47780 [Nannocystis sp. RBIL2]|uniref:hypothetical protein n=1 Tax=Nannocystis sp. RBIL2 TaxID=2996788 RepID=UPI00226EF362|nr:hypothetical protein [Nannocystis sp. RBIL2]MCY1072540.1 hypothetical protein [Nannocystis sp. RBIL2]